MARTNVPPTVLTANAETDDPAGTSIDPTNGHVITGVPLEELVLEIDATFAGAKNYTIKAGSNPPADAAGQGDLVVALNAEVGMIGPFTSARFKSLDDGTDATGLWVDAEAGSTGTIKAFHVPRTA